ncbi:MAG: outer membrane beta-barrel protein [Geothrix sp.]|uniref:outer membrane beta-barrel protein n=1 Tax=Geothrix sp. TaxID=1962974 RepID=UPI0018278119|nr:outer membrane beta-barrel protein [Geothrix sp.]NWJ40486.1 outer membrane beta-barrel protein [Geothrix sp.]WIL21509.1 MAG: porin [Geothrix sp.]
MRTLSPLLPLVATTLLAQAPSPGTTPTLKWRGSLWASAVTQNRDTTDGSLAFRPLEAGQGQFTLDGLMLGVDATLTSGWSAKATLLTGQAGKVVQSTTGDSGTIAPVEAMLVWTGERDTFRIGRMITFIGMEFLDGVQDVTASRGLLFSFVDPFGQVGINWHHAFSPVWSTDVWAFNGEDRTRDNNHGKTVGLGLTYNHAGSQDNFLSLHAYSGSEQDGFGAAANTGAEGRKRERLCLMGQWIAGASTFQWEASLGRESFATGSILGATAPATATWRGYGFICKRELMPSVSLFARAEWLSDDLGVRLSADPTIREGLGLAGPIAYAGRMGANLQAQGISLGVEKKHGPAFARLELRQDRLNRDLTDAQGRTFRESASGTLSLGASF